MQQEARRVDLGTWRISPFEMKWLRLSYYWQSATISVPNSAKRLNFTRVAADALALTPCVAALYSAAQKCSRVIREFSVLSAKEERRAPS
jgi:hypothetical protein